MNAKATKHCLVIGDPVAHSLSPAIHNAGYAALGIQDAYSYSARRVSASDLEDFLASQRHSNTCGISCTMPHKEAIIPLLDSVDDVARTIGAVNTVTISDGRLHGLNTDWIGAVAPLQALTPLKAKQVAVLGAGGAAKAFVYGLMQEGANVTILNRTKSKADQLAGEFGCKSADLADNEAISRSDIVCNTTTVGMGDPTQSPLPPDVLKSDQIVFDAVYVPYETKLLTDAKTAGARVVHGTEMLLHQGMAQFKLFTGLDAPEAAMRQALMAALAERNP
jgi:shikimate dehydrogenase